MDELEELEEMNRYGFGIQKTDREVDISAEGS